MRAVARISSSAVRFGYGAFELTVLKAVRSEDILWNSLKFTKKDLTKHNASIGCLMVLMLAF